MDAERIKRDLKYINKKYYESGMLRQDKAGKDEDDQHLSRAGQICGAVLGYKTVGDNARDKQQEKHHGPEQGEHAQQYPVFLTDTGQLPGILFLPDTCIKK